MKLPLLSLEIGAPAFLLLVGVRTVRNSPFAALVIKFVVEGESLLEEAGTNEIRLPGLCFFFLLGSTKASAEADSSNFLFILTK